MHSVASICALICDKSLCFSHDICRTREEEGTTIGILVMQQHWSSSLMRLIDTCCPSCALFIPIVSHSKCLLARSPSSLAQPKLALFWGQRPREKQLKSWGLFGTSSPPLLLLIMRCLADTELYPMYEPKVLYQDRKHHRLQWKMMPYSYYVTMRASAASVL